MRKDTIRFFIVIAAVVFCFYYLMSSGFFNGLVDYLYSVFVLPVDTAFVAFGQGGDYIMVGVVLLLVSIGFYIFFAFMMKLLVIDVVFPRFRTIDEFKNRIKHARLICKSKAPKNIFQTKSISDIFTTEESNDGKNLDFYWSKFKLLPILEFQRIAVDKRWKRRRFPWTLDIFTNNLNLTWNEKLQSWELKYKSVTVVEDDIGWYKTLAVDDVRELGDNVQFGVKGDYGLIKSKFKQGLAIQKVKRQDEGENINDGTEADSR